MTLRALCLRSLAASLFGVLVSDAPLAEACSTVGPGPALEGYPEDGAVGVPTDVLPIYRISAAYHALNELYELDIYAQSEDRRSSFELVDDAGVVTRLSSGARGGAWFVELVPPTELAPRTRYVLRTIAGRSVGDGLQVSFTTGDGAHPGPPAPPTAAIEHFTFESANPTSCSPWSNGTCLELPELAPGVYVEEVPFQSGTPFRSDYTYLSRTSRFTNIAGIDQGTPYDCIELRTRAPNGTFSDAVTLCREDGELYDIRGSEDIACTGAGMTQDGRLVSVAAAAPAGGAVDGQCNVAAGGTSTPLTPLSALPYALPLLVLWGRQKRRDGQGRSEGRARRVAPHGGAETSTIWLS